MSPGLKIQESKLSEVMIHQNLVSYRLFDAFAQILHKLLAFVNGLKRDCFLFSVRPLHHLFSFLLLKQASDHTDHSVSVQEVDGTS